MDKKTIDIYDKSARTLAEQHRAQNPERLFHIIEVFFQKGGATADLGCGSGRDTKKLNEMGFPATGFDASQGMLVEAKKFYPECKFEFSVLPNLEEIEDQTFQNILCSAVLMHIPEDQLVLAVINLLRITTVSGRIIVSFCPARPTEERLYLGIDSGKLQSLFESLGGRILFSEENPDRTRPDVSWHTLVIEKTEPLRKDGIFSAQRIITQDSKTSTYKFALLRSLCYIAQHEQGIVNWQTSSDFVHIPMERISLCWLKYYWPLVKKDIRQITGKKPLAFQSAITDLPYEEKDLYILLTDFDSESIEKKQILKVLAKIRSAIIAGPIRHSGGGNDPIFRFDESSDSMRVPVAIWLDMIRFSHWIESSLIIEWAKLTEGLNSEESFGDYLGYLTEDTFPKRATYPIRQLLKGQDTRCVWTGRKIEKFDVDHVLPYGIWKNNDLWNLMPSSQTLNSQKGAKIPDQETLMNSKDLIIEYWQRYRAKWPRRFEVQIQRSFGLSRMDNYENTAHLKLIETCERIAHHCGLERWRSRINQVMNTA